MRKLIASLLLLFVASIAQSAIIASASPGTSFASSGNVSSFTLNRPGAVSANDLLFVQITVGSNVTVTAPSGWTLLLDHSLTSSTIRQFVYYHVAASSETAGSATSWSLSGNTHVVAAMTGYRSNTSGQVAGLGTVTATTGSGTTLTAPAMSATAAGRLLRFYGHRSTNTLSSGTLTTHASRAADTSVTLLTGSRSIAAAGTTTTDIITASTSANFIIGSILLTEIPAKPTTCYSDTFSSSTTFANNWVTKSVGSTAFIPATVGGRLRLTDNNGYESTAATLQRLFPTSNSIYVEFNHYAYPSNTGADGIAVTLSDASITPQPGGFGGSLGYAQRSDSGGIPGFAGGWMGIALDEYGNFSNPSEGRNGGPGFRVDSVAVRGSGSGQTGYAYIAGTATLNPEVDSISNPGPGYRYRIVVDAVAAGQTYVTVDRDTTGTGSSYTNLIPTFNIQASAGQAAIPANLMLSLTGSTGGSRNIHEIGNLSVCATTINTTTQVDHFEITHDNEGLTCEPEDVSIRACANADCSILMSVPVDITLDPSTGWVGGNVQTITGGSAVIQLRQTTSATVGFKVTHSTPGTKPFTSNRCNGVAMTTSAPNCNLPFVDAGLAFDVPNFLANKPSGAVRLRAVKNAGDPNNSCVALFQDTTQSINFWSTYTTPNTGTRPVGLRAGSGSGAFANISGSSASPTELSLTFDTNGETTFETRYPDAGLMALNARYNAAPSGVYAGLILNGSDSFVSTPAGFCVRGAKLAASPSYANCIANFATCPVIATVLNPFVLDITAAAWEVDGDPDFCVGNGSTPNYAQNSLGLSSQFGLTAMEFNASGTASNGTTTPTTVNITAGSGGNVNLTNATESEVGAFEFVVTPPPNAYFGATVPAGKNRPIGRFIPHHFAVNSSNSSHLINRATSCNPQPTPAPIFNYMGERFDLSFTVTAQNASNQTTQNYQGVFAKLFNFSDLSLKAVSPVTGTSRTVFDSNDTNARLKLFDAINNPMSVSWTNGAGSFTLPLTLARGSTTDGVYANTALGILPTDSDSVVTTGIVPPAFGPLLPLNLDTKTHSNTSYDHVQTGSNTEFRYGRLRLDGANGPVDMPLALPTTTEYWSGTAFVTNTADAGCTTINSSSATLDNYLGSLSDGHTLLSGSGVIIAGKAPSAIQLSAPGTGREGRVDVTLPIPNWPWLQFDWNGDNALDTSVKATASFGTYRGSDRVIYWLETQ